MPKSAVPFLGTLSKQRDKAIEPIAPRRVAGSGTCAMLKHHDLNALLASFKEAQTLDQLHKAMMRATRVLGFSQFAMGHHVNLQSPPEGAIHLTTYNEDWISHGLERGYFGDDPIHLASTRTVNGFLWRDVAEIIQLTARHKQVLAEATGFGLGAGFTVPVYLPGEFHGSCSFATCRP